MNGWLEKTPPHQLAGDVKAVLSAGAAWPDKRGFALLMRDLAPVLISMRQPAQAFAAVEAGLAAAPGFTLEQENAAVLMMRYALQTGRKRLAATLLANFMARGPRSGEPGPALLELQSQLQQAVRPLV